MPLFQQPLRLPCPVSMNRMHVAAKRCAMTSVVRKNSSQLAFFSDHTHHRQTVIHRPVDLHSEARPFSFFKNATVARKAHFSDPPVQATRSPIPQGRLANRDYLIDQTIRIPFHRRHFFGRNFLHEYRLQKTSQLRARMRVRRANRQTFQRKPKPLRDRFLQPRGDAHQIRRHQQTRLTILPKCESLSVQLTSRTLRKRITPTVPAHSNRFGRSDAYSRAPNRN